MMFLTPIMLIGLAALAIPIIVHLLNRRRAEVVPWGAMQFLTDSLSSRRRRILLEEIILMIMRCLALALVVLAMARPYLPSRSVIPWTFVLPAALLAAMAMGVATAAWSYPRTRNILLGLAGVLVAAAAVVALMEYHYQSGRWNFQSRADIAIVIDGSASMTLTGADGKTNFQKALDEAAGLVGRSRPGDTVTVLLAAESTRVIAPAAPSADPGAARRELLATLKTLAPPGGPLRVMRVLHDAADILAAGHNATQRIVLLTDEQAVGWRPGDSRRWRALAATLSGAEARAAPKILCRRLAIPDKIDNVAVTGVRALRKVVGTDRSVEFEVTLANVGVATVADGAVTFTLNGQQLHRKPVPRLLAGQETTVTFRHQFKTPGQYFVETALSRVDAVAADNVASRVVRVLGELPVLIVQDAPPTGALEDAGEPLRVALAPDSGAAQDPYAERLLVVPKVVSAADAAAITDFSRYRMIVLADVTRLPASTLTALADYVVAGGGLWVLPGPRVRAELYNKWAWGERRPVLPAKLVKWHIAADRPAHPVVSSFSHPALAWTSDVPRCDAGRAAIRGWWQLQVRPGEKDKVVLGAKMDNGLPLLTEHRLGEGRVMMWAISCQISHTDWPKLKGFVPTVHELTYHLAEAGDSDNVPCGSSIAFELLRKSQKEKKPAAGRAVVTTPSGRKLPVEAFGTARGLSLKLQTADEPGLYTFALPKSLAESYEMPTPKSNEVRVAAVPSPGEPDLTRLGANDLKAIGENVDLYVAQSAADLFSAAAGMVPGQEFWQHLAFVALMVLVVEVGLARWIARHRQSHSAPKVEFSADAIDLGTFRAETASKQATARAALR